MNVRWPLKRSCNDIKFTPNCPILKKASTSINHSLSHDDLVSTINFVYVASKFRQNSPLIHPESDSILWLQIAKWRVNVTVTAENRWRSVNQRKQDSILNSDNIWYRCCNIIFTYILLGEIKIDVQHYYCISCLISVLKYLRN